MPFNGFSLSTCGVTTTQFTVQNRSIEPIVLSSWCELGIGREHSDRRLMSFRQQIDERATGSVAEVIFSARRMVDGVATSARCPTFQAEQLSDKALVVEQINFAGIQARQEIAVNFG